jgi:Zn-dependent M28 family amino/carboxypeptidase
MDIRALAATAAVALAAGCAGSSSAPVSVATAPHVSIGQLPDIDAHAVVAHAQRLSSDAFEGRAPATPGETKTVRYLVDAFRERGLQPGNPDGSFIQKVPLVGITASPAPLVFAKGDQRLSLAWKDEVVAVTRHVTQTASVRDSEVVFVGYGVVAPEFGWDDYKGLDVRGKTLVMLVNDPPVTDPDNPSELDPKVFGGKAMTYYGRWTYKYEIGAEKGAAAVVIVHETATAGYPFSILQDSTLGENFDLVTPDRNMSRASIEAWIPVDAAKRLMALAGQDFDALKQQAATRDFRPVPLNVTASMTLRNRLRTVQSQNVLARLEGADPVLKSEYVVYTAHWDHLGKTPEGVFHGAQDDAVGCGALVEIARGFTKASPPPKRTVLFIALTSEEQGLLGSDYYTRAPLYPLAKTLANINLDPNGWNVYGRTRDVTLVGYGASDLDDYVRDVAGEQGRVVHGDSAPEKGFYYRSDHFNFARRGVPALEPEHGIDFIGKPPGYAAAVQDDWIAHRYHKPADVVSRDWDVTGLAEDLKLYFAVGYRVAQADRFPEWKPGNEFRAVRQRQLGR